MPSTRASRQLGIGANVPCLVLPWPSNALSDEDVVTVEGLMYTTTNTTPAAVASSGMVSPLSVSPLQVTR